MSDVRKKFSDMTPEEKAKKMVTLQKKDHLEDKYFSVEDRDFLKPYIREQIKNARNLTDLNNIYNEHISAPHARQHRSRGSTLRLDYTETQTILINALRARATEIYDNPILNNSKLQHIQTLADDMKLVPETALGNPLKLEDQNDSKLEDQKQTGTRSPLLDFLLTREKHLPNARFMSREHDSYLKQGLKKIGDMLYTLILYIPVEWVYQPTVYSAREKPIIRNHLNAEINAAKTFTDLMNIYDRYKDTVFINERRHAAFLGKASYSQTKIEFIAQLRNKATELDRHNQDLSLADTEKLQKATEERGQLLSHAIFSPIHEGRTGVKDDAIAARILLEGIQTDQLGPLSSRYLAAASPAVK